MKTWEIEPYTAEKKTLWDTMLATARNASFLFRRDYMDYHADRFTDASIIASYGGVPVALLPANRSGKQLYSHQGLTYGGWIWQNGKTDGGRILELFDVWLDWCARNGITVIHYKPLPYIYASEPSQEDIYALWRYNAVTECVQLSSVIDRSSDPGFDYMRRRYLKRTGEYGVRVQQTDELTDFWKILVICLADRHGANPVHTLSEMQRLMSLFPNHIRLFTINDNEGMQAGILVYSTGMVDHCQYIATTEKARRLRYLPYLVTQMKQMLNARYFDFGTSNEDGGKLLNASLLSNKFGMGATGVAYPQYKLEL